MPDTPAKILIVEDRIDPDDMVRHLTLTGCEPPVVAHSIKAARAALRRYDFDLVLCDLELPDGNGCALMELLSADYDLGGIALTAEQMPSLTNRLRKAGFEQSVVTSTDVGQLKVMIEQFLAKQRATTLSVLDTWVGDVADA